MNSGQIMIFLSSFYFYSLICETYFDPFFGDLDNNKPICILEGKRLLVNLGYEVAPLFVCGKIALARKYNGVLML